MYSDKISAESEIIHLVLRQRNFIVHSLSSQSSIRQQVQTLYFLLWNWLNLPTDPYIIIIIIIIIKNVKIRVTLSWVTLQGHFTELLKSKTKWSAAGEWGQCHASVSSNSHVFKQLRCINKLFYTQLTMVNMSSITMVNIFALNPQTLIGEVKLLCSVSQ